MMRSGRVFLVAAGLLALAGCEHKSEPPTGGMPPLPNAQPLVPGPGAVHPPTGANSGDVPEGLPPGHPQLPPGHPGMGGEGAGLPPGHPPMGGEGGPIVGETPVGDADPKATVTGTIVLSDKIKDKVQAGDVIFLVARQDDGTEKGTVLAVRKLVAGAWPQSFMLDGSTPMFPGTKFAGKVLISARVDKDGDGMTKNPGDALGLLHTTVPASDVKIVIDTITQ
jgi:hypothetical protein